MGISEITLRYPLQTHRHQGHRQLQLTLGNKGNAGQTHGLGPVQEGPRHLGGEDPNPREAGDREERRGSDRMPLGISVGRGPGFAYELWVLP